MPADGNRYADKSMTFSDPYKRIIDYWGRIGIAIRPGVSAGAIAAFQSKYHVMLPAGVREYFMATDGTGDDMDDGLYRFWPFDEVKPVHEELAIERGSYPDRFAYPDCFVFADYSIWCWAYAFKLSDDPSQPAPVFRVTASDPPGEQMASSFVEFMSQYANHPDNIF